MNILLDTHTFLGFRTAPEKIPEKVLAAYYDINNDVFLSIASVWEMQIKHQLGKLDLKRPLNTLIEEQCINNGLQILAIETYHIFALADLPFHHKETLNKSFDCSTSSQLRTNGKLLIPFVVSLSNHERNQLIQSFHKDPFDRLILIQSKLENLKLASADSVFEHYDISLFWH